MTGRGEAVEAACPPHAQGCSTTPASERWAWSEGLPTGPAGVSPEAGGLTAVHGLFYEPPARPGGGVHPDRGTSNFQADQEEVTLSTLRPSIILNLPPPGHAVGLLNTRP